MGSTLKFVLLFALAAILASIDPFGLDPLGSESDSAIKSLYFIIPLIGFFVLFVSPTFKSASADPKVADAINQEAIKSFVRSILQAIGSVLAFIGATGIKIPYLNVISDLAAYIGSTLDIAVQAVSVIVGIVIYLIGFFRDKNRFTARIITGRKIAA